MVKNDNISGKVKLIPRWNEKQLTCYYCGSNKSVKYQIEQKNKTGIIFCCNRCVMSTYI